LHRSFAAKNAAQDGAAFLFFLRNFLRMAPT
jgi:hypothetical protein